MLVYKINPLKELKKRGWSSGSLQRERKFGSALITRMKMGIVLGTTNNSGLDVLCELLDKQPGEIIEWMPIDKVKQLKEIGYFEKMDIPVYIGEEE